jgi:hypothetical protein
MPRDRIELDLHRLELRFADSRLVEPGAVARLAESIERCGQIVPCIVVAAPGSQSVTVTKTPAQIEVRHKSTTIATHRRVIDQRDTRKVLPGHHTIPVRQGRGTAAEEALLRGHHDSLDRYTAALRWHGRAGNRRALRRLIEMRRTYPPGPFIAAIEQALRYGLFDLTCLEHLILKQVGGDFFALNTAEPDDA